jgi:hypothetical protein
LARCGTLNTAAARLVKKSTAPRLFGEPWGRSSQTDESDGALALLLGASLQDAVNHGAGFAKIIGWIAQPRQRGPLDMRCDFVVLSQ